MSRLAQCLRLIAPAVALLIASVPVRAQNAKTLKRIAEALDGHAGSGPVFVVLAPDVVSGIVPSRGEADALARSVRDARVYGPFDAELPDPMRFISKCFHWRSAMAGICPDINLAELLDVTISFRMRDGQVHNVTMPRGADALILTGSAFDKFVFPYYARVYGVDSAAAMRRSLLPPPR